MSSPDLLLAERSVTVASAIARFAVSQGIQRLYTLPGSHVKPICSEMARAGIEIISARDERAAIHMAHAEADLTNRIGMALVTTGPGFTNAVTGIASAFLARTPLLVMSARVPDPQAGMGALEEIPQADIVRPICRYVREIRDTRHVLTALNQAAAHALGSDGPPGPVYVDFDPGLIHREMPEWHLDARWFLPAVRAARLPDHSSIVRAAQLLGESRRPLVIGGRGVVRAGTALDKFLRKFRCLYVDTRESRGTLPPENPFSVAAVRARVMTEADLIITLGKRLDFELAYGSSAIFSEAARFLRIGRDVEELSENRRGDVEVCGDVVLALEALLDNCVELAARDTVWIDGLMRANAEKVRAKAGNPSNPMIGVDGRMHPQVLVEALNRITDDDTISIVDGGDILSFARVGLRANTYLDLGPFGCLGCGVPYAIAAALAFPNRRTIALVGDGAFGFSAIEIETAVRTGARPLIVVANNDAWNIERHDQLKKYPDQELGGTLSSCRYDQLGRSLGAYGEHVECPDELEGALERGLANLPAVIDVAITRDAVSPDSRSGLANVPPLHATQPWDDAERRKLGNLTD